MDEREEPFADGNLSTVTRVGHTVRRERRPWTPVVHRLLRHLESVGFDGAPRALGFDGRGREILSYIEGATMPASLAGFRSDVVLVEVAKLLRRYHDAATTFATTRDDPWQWKIAAPPTPQVICHNDIAPYNTVVHDGQPVAFIDWDFAAPGPRIWDIAHALWRFVPFYDGGEHGAVEERARRARVFCDAYGFSEYGEILRWIQHRMAASYTSVAAWGAAGDPAFVRLWREGHAEGVLADLEYLRRHWLELELHLSG
jgi:aminoglycoside phosphotransferase (APT) family kinase protein